MDYNKGLVAYIDILGTKNSNFDDLFKINEIFHKELSRIKNNDMFCKKYVTSFSDCAFIVYSIDNKNESSFDFLFNDSLSDLSNSICAILANGFLCRGGVCFGDYYFEENKKYIFGSAINEAYKLESDESMPRIIINDSLGEEIYNNESRIIKNDFQKLIRKDKVDSRYYLNYLYTFSSNDCLDFDDGLYNGKMSFGEEEYLFDDFYTKLINYSICTIDKEKDYGVIAKHEWQLKYLRQHKKDREMVIKNSTKL